MQILVEVPATFPDAMQCSPQQFVQEAKLAMGIKLYEMKRLSSGMAALLVGMERVQFLGELHRNGIAVIDLDDDELAEDVINA
jgi:predicted HTH domain antitoxin